MLQRGNLRALRAAGPASCSHVYRLLRLTRGALIAPGFSAEPGMAADTANGAAAQAHEHTNGVTANGRANGRKSAHSRAASGHNTLEDLAAMQKVALQRHRQQLRSDPELAAAGLDEHAQAELNATFERGGSCNEMLQTICRVYAKRRAFGYSADGSANFKYVTYEELNQRVLRLAAGVFHSCCLQCKQMA